MEKVKVLANYLEVEEDEIQENNYGTFEHGSQEYMVLDDEEADEKVKENIKETLWAFRPSFLANQTDLPQSVFDAFVKADLCESANEAIEALVEKTCGIDDFVDEAVSCDGRGHFLSGYDGEEIEQDDFYIYRLN